MELKSLEKLIRFIACRVADRLAEVILERMNHMSTQVEQLQKSIDALSEKFSGAVQRQAAKIKQQAAQIATQAQTIVDLKQQLGGEDLSAQLSELESLGQAADQIEVEPTPALPGPVAPAQPSAPPAPPDPDMPF